MAGHARERRPGVWELRAYAGRDPLTGAKKYETSTVKAKGKREAQRLADAFAVEVASGGKPAAAMTVGALLERWFAARAGDWSPGTALETRRRIDGYMKGLHDVELRKLDADGLDAFYAALRQRGARDGKPLAASTVVRVHGDLRVALDQAVRWGLIKANPADVARPRRAKKRKIKRPDDEAIAAILEGAEARDPELLTFLFLDAETGARRAELAAVRLSDFGQDDVTIERALTVGLATDENAVEFEGHYWPSDHERGRFRTALIEKDPKTDESVRTLSLHPFTMGLVRDQIVRIASRVALSGLAYPDDGFLFPAAGDGTRPLRPDTWGHRFIRLRDAVDVKIRLHDVRHYVATTLLTSGVDLATVAGRLGHGGGGKTTLAIYAHFARKPDRAASDLIVGILRKASPADDDTPDNVIQLRPSAS